MSTPAVSNVSLFQEIQGFFQNRRTDLQQLGSALQSGNLEAAQQAFSALDALGQSGPFRNSEPFSNNSRANDFEAIGNALQVGDLAGAQAAFATLKQTLGSHQTSGGGQTAAFVVNIAAAQNGPADDTQSIYQQRQEFRAERQTDLAQLGQALQAGDANAAQLAFNTLITLGQNGPFSNGQPFHRTDRAQDFTAIGQALQNGDLTGAQQAFAALNETISNQAQSTVPIIINLPGTTPPVPGPPTGPPTVAPPNTVPLLTGLPPAPVPPTFQPPTTSTIPPSTLPPTVSSFPGPGPQGPPERVINIGANGSTSGNNQAEEIVVNVGANANSAAPEEIQINFGGNGSGGSLTVGVNQPHNGISGEEIDLSFNAGNTNYQLVVNLLNSVASSSQPQNNSLSLTA